MAATVLEKQQAFENSPDLLVWKLGDVGSEERQQYRSGNGDQSSNGGSLGDVMFNCVKWVARPDCLLPFVPGALQDDQDLHLLGLDFSQPPHSSRCPPGVNASDTQRFQPSARFFAANS